MCSLRLLKNASAPITSAPVRFSRRVAKAASSSRSVLAATTSRRSPSAPVAAARSRVWGSARTGLLWVDEEPEAAGSRDDGAEQLQLLCSDLRAQGGHARKVAAWTVEARDETKLHRVDRHAEDDRHSRGRRLGGDRRRRIAKNDDHGNGSKHELGSERQQ